MFIRGFDCAGRRILTALLLAALGCAGAPKAGEPAAGKEKASAPPAVKVSDTFSSPPAPAPAPAPAEGPKVTAIEFGTGAAALRAELDAAGVLSVKRGPTVLVRAAELRLAGEAGQVGHAALGAEGQKEPDGTPVWQLASDKAPGAPRARLRALSGGGALALAWETSFREPAGLKAWAYVLELAAEACAGRSLRLGGATVKLPRAPAAANAAVLWSGAARGAELLDGDAVVFRVLRDVPARAVLRDLRAEGQPAFSLAFLGEPVGEGSRAVGRFALALVGSAEPMAPLVYSAELWPPARAGAPLVAELAFIADYGSPFNPAEVAVDALVAPPLAAPYRQPAFYTQDYRLTLIREEKAEKKAAAGDKPAEVVEREALAPWGGPVWRALIAPERAGEHRVAFEVRTPAGTARAEPRPVLLAEPPPPPAGPLRASKPDSRYLADPAGKPVFLVGHNLGWVLSPKPMQAWTDALERMRRAGLNYARVWTCSWSLSLETPEPWVYDLEDAWRLERVLEEAAARGVYVQLCLDNFHDFSQNRGQSPYFAAKGAACKSPRDFFAAEGARAMYRARLRYLAGRYGRFQNLLAWELFNELDYCVDKKNPEELAAARREFLAPWARWAAGELAGLDRGRHLVTCSLADGEVWPELAGAPEFGLVESHLYLYMPEVGKAARSERDAFGPVLAELARYAKPALVSEYGFGAAGGGKSEINDADRLGVHLHNGLWLSALSGSAGAAALWWWDSYLSPPGAAEAGAAGAAPTITGEDRYGHYRALAAYVRGVDWLAGWKPLVTAPPAAPGVGVDVTGLRTDRGALFWLQDTANTWYNRIHKQYVPARVEKASFTIDGLVPGEYLVEWWDAYNGRVLTSSRQRTGEKGSLAIEAPPFTRDLAGKLKFLEAIPAPEAAEGAK